MRLTSRVFTGLLCISLCGVASRASAQVPVPIGDPSFENQSLVDEGGKFNYAEAPWETGTPGSIGWVALQGNFGMNFAPDGDNISSVSDDYMAQNLAATYKAGKTYTLTALAALRAATDSQGAANAWRISLQDTLGNELASNAAEFDLLDPTSAADYQLISVSYTATGADDGNNIRIYFDTNGGSALNGDDTFPFVNSGNFRFSIDDVNLTYIPEPTSVTFIGIASLLAAAVYRNRK